MRMLTIACLAACGPSPATQKPAPVAASDGVVNAPRPGAGVPAAVASAPAWIVRYTGGGREEAWTLRQADGAALVIVETPLGSSTYTGSVDAGGLKFTLSSGSNPLSLDCKREQLEVGAKCGDKTTKKIDVLACIPSDATPTMHFAAAPGVEFAMGLGCAGYRLLEK